MPISLGPVIPPGDHGDVVEASTTSPEPDLGRDRRTDSLGQVHESSVSIKEVGTDCSDSEIYDEDAIDNVELIGCEAPPGAAGTSSRNA